MDNNDSILKISDVDSDHSVDNEIILYQPNSTFSLDVRVDKETVWLTQPQIAELFGTKRPAITKHLSNIFKSGELDEDSVCSILELTAADGKNYRTKFYNLDAILSVVYRVKSSFHKISPPQTRYFMKRAFIVQKIRPVSTRSKPEL